ncbi:MAG TPA: hypothetical protein PLL39_03345 [Rhodocyclaceae bacterium]|nr:hypothetical protein [Rhodocyclaceae bacterium]
MEAIEQKSKPVRNVVISVHGIRTFGQWQERLARLVRQADPQAISYSYHYGFFSVLAFLVPPLRGIEVARFRRHLQRIVDMHPQDRISVVGHSFGTHLIGWALAKSFKTHGTPIHQIILAGSVLRSTFDWHDLIEKGVANRIIKDCGIDDNVLLLSQVAVLFTGMAGRLGFTGAVGAQLCNRYFLGGHSHYFLGDNGQADDAFMLRYWLPLLVQSSEPEEVDQRLNGGPLQGVYVWMIQNADVVKVGVLLSIGFLVWQMLYATPRAMALAESLSHARAVALQQIGVDEQTPHGVANLLNIIRRDPEDVTSRELVSRWLPELENYSEVVSQRGLPALMVWNGHNLLVSKDSTVDLGGAVILTYGFSRDGTQLIAFDADGTIRIVQVYDAKNLLSISTRKEVRESIVLKAPVETSSAEEYESIGEVLGKANPQAARLSFDGELESISFRESPDGIYLWGVGTSAAESAGLSEGVLFAVNRKTMSYAFCRTSNDLRLLLSGERVRAFATYQPDDPDTEQSQKDTARAEVMMELRWPDRTNGFSSVKSDGKESTPQLPTALVEQVKRLGKEDLPSQRIGSMGLNQVLAKRGAIESDEWNDESPVLVYPNLRPAHTSWTVSMLSQNNMSSIGVDLLAEIPHARIVTNEESKAVHRQLRAYIQKMGEEHLPAEYLSAYLSDGYDEGDIVLVPERKHVVYLLRGSDGAKYGVTVYCVAKDISGAVEFCDYIRARGNFVSVAISDDGRYLVGGDFAGLGQPGIHFRNLASNRMLEVNEQPSGGVRFLTFAPGETTVFASTPYGILEYAMESDAVRYVRRYELPALAAELAEGTADYSRRDIRASATHLFYVSYGGVVQALSRKTGLADWLVRLPVSGAGLAFDSSTQILAVYGDRCVHLMHSSSGARIARPLCVTDVAASDQKVETEESITLVRFEAAGLLNVFTDARKFSRKFLPPKEAAIEVTEKMSFYSRWLARIGLSRSAEMEAQQQDWIRRTGYDHLHNPVRALTVLPGQDRTK